MHHCFEWVQCTESTELQLKSLLQMILPLIIECSVLIIRITGELKQSPYLK